MKKTLRSRLISSLSAFAMVLTSALPTGFSFGASAAEDTFTVKFNVNDELGTASVMPDDVAQNYYVLAAMRDDTGQFTAWNIAKFDPTVANADPKEYGGYWDSELGQYVILTHDTSYKGEFAFDEFYVYGTDGSSTVDTTPYVSGSNMYVRVFTTDDADVTTCADLIEFNEEGKPVPVSDSIKDTIGGYIFNTPETQAADTYEMTVSPCNATFAIRLTNYEPVAIEPTDEVYLLIEAVHKTSDPDYFVQKIPPFPRDPIMIQETNTQRWLDKNGYAIYGTRPLYPYCDGNKRYTQSKDGRHQYEITLLDDYPYATVKKLKRK